MDAINQLSNKELNSRLAIASGYVIELLMGISKHDHPDNRYLFSHMQLAASLGTGI